MNLKGEIMSKSAERDRQRTWAHTQWHLGHSGDLGARSVAPKCLVLHGWASGDDIDVNFRIWGVFLT